MLRLLCDAVGRVQLRWSYQHGTKDLKTAIDNTVALAYVDTLMDAEPGSQEEQELQLYSQLVATYEREHYSIDAPTASKALQDQASVHE